jgi:transcriptional antiterminator Rof (Rho-off)
MYTLAEIRTIFSNCANWDELELACRSFLFLIADGALPLSQKIFIAEQSQKRFKQIENL